jgi:FKBP-type peptidyl-prolyl cis-trans isomerase
VNRAGAVVAAVGLAALVGCGGGGDSGVNTLTAPSGSQELVIEDVVVGDGATAAAGQTLSVHYVGTFTDGTVFESSRARGEPLVFTVGVGQVIEGWDRGIPGMRVGGTRRLTIPPSLAYGSQGRGPIPPNATLLFEVELLEIL